MSSIIKDLDFVTDLSEEQLIEVKGGDDDDGYDDDRDDDDDDDRDGRNNKKKSRGGKKHFTVNVYHNHFYWGVPKHTKNKRFWRYY